MRQAGPFTKNILDSLDTTKASSGFDLVCKIWPNAGLSTRTFRENEYASFLGYVNQELLYLRQHQTEFAAESLEGTIDLISLLKSDLDQPRHAVLRRVRELYPDVEEAHVIRTLELVARLWLTTRVAMGDMATIPVFGMIEWTSDISLRDAIQSHYPLAEPEDKVEKYFSQSLDPSFTAATLVEVCRVRLSWTSNLMDHLRFDKRHRILMIYEHKVCLLNHCEGVDSPLPLALLQETIDTLNLLFPFVSIVFG
ncbi:hypothetical protein N0V90_012007 [Kalmusia sp. IMI 367209]|nr:hypothetical protein N0V90_012007 [Kalmusia sp. IMI 367209]